MTSPESCAISSRLIWGFLSVSPLLSARACVRNMRWLITHALLMHARCCFIEEKLPASATQSNGRHDSTGLAFTGQSTLLSRHSTHRERRCSATKSEPRCNSTDRPLQCVATHTPTFCQRTATCLAFRRPCFDCFYEGKATLPSSRFGAAVATLANV